MTTETPKLPITVLVQTKNEEKGIRSCLESLHFFQEVIVVDSNSKDRTKEVALSLGARVENFTWNGQYPKKKQWQLKNLRVGTDWVLFLDADEIPSKSLQSELATIFLNGKTVDFAAFDIKLDYYFEGKCLRFGHRVSKRALVNRHKTNFPTVDDLGIPGMGELEGHYQPSIDGTIGSLKGRLIHNDLDPVSSWFTRHNKYSDWEAELKFRETAVKQVKANKSKQGKVFEKVPLKPVVFFLYSYVLKLGFLDGMPGLDYSLALSFYYWQIDLKVRYLYLGERSGLSSGKLPT